MNIQSHTTLIYILSRTFFALPYIFSYYILLTSTFDGPIFWQARTTKPRDKIPHPLTQDKGNESPIQFYSFHDLISGIIYKNLNKN